MNRQHPKKFAKNLFETYVTKLPTGMYDHYLWKRTWRILYYLPQAKWARVREIDWRPGERIHSSFTRTTRRRDNFRGRARSSGSVLQPYRSRLEEQLDLTAANLFRWQPKIELRGKRQWLAVGRSTAPTVGFWTNAKFRQCAIAIIADLAKMYLNISVRPAIPAINHQSPESSHPDHWIQSSLFCSKCSPYLAQAVIKKLAEHVKTTLPLASIILDKACYIDDLQFSTTAEAEESLRQLQSALGAACFEMHNQLFIGQGMVWIRFGYSIREVNNGVGHSMELRIHFDGISVVDMSLQGNKFILLILFMTANIGFHFLYGVDCSLTSKSK